MVYDGPECARACDVGAATGWILRVISHNRLEEGHDDDRWTQYRPCPVPHRAAGSGEPGLDAEPADHVRQRVAVRAGRRGVRRRLRRTLQRAGQLPQRLPPPRPGHPGRHPGCGGAQAAAGQPVPGLAAGAAQACRAGPDQRGGDLLPARGLHPPDGQTRAGVGHHWPVQVPGLGDGQGTRRARRAVPHPPTAGRRSVHVRGRRRPGPQGARRRPRRTRTRARRDRCQRRWTPRDPGGAGHHQRGRRRLARVLPRPDRPRLGRGQARHLRCPRRAGVRDRRHAARCGLAALPHPLVL